MKLKDKIVVAIVALLIVTWLFPPMSKSPRFQRKNVETPKVFDGFHFILSNDPYANMRVLKIDWTKLVIINMVILGAGGSWIFVVSKKKD
jgi:hypothetical protein